MIVETRLKFFSEDIKQATSDEIKLKTILALRAIQQATIFQAFFISMFFSLFLNVSNTALLCHFGKRGSTV